MQHWLVWNLLFPLHERLKGHPTMAILKELEAADCLTSSDLEALRCAKLQQLMAYCYAHVPYVRTGLQRAGIMPSEFQNVSDLARLPLMRKADIRNNRASLRSNVAGKLSTIATGGSTGAPLICDISKRRAASRVACRQRVSRWWGLSVGDPEVAVWGSPVELSRQDRLRALRDWAFATRLLPAFEMDEPTMSRYLDVIESIAPRQIFGYPSALYLLCLHAQQHRKSLRHLGVKVAFVTGEVLLPHQRVYISETLNCPVADGYGGRDSGFIAHECPQGSMHIMSDAVIVELVDPEGRPVKPGQAGEIVVTDLYSHEAPFIRYATGDVGTISGTSCRCGRSLPVLDRVEGRANDSIVSADGRVINSLALIYPLREVTGIEQFRIYQHSVDSFHVELVRNGAFTTDAEETIRQIWAKLFRSAIHVTFEYLPRLSPDRSGKFRHVVSRVPAGMGFGSVPPEATGASEHSDRERPE